MKKNKLNINNKTEKFVKIVPRSYVYQQPIKSLVFLNHLENNQNFVIGTNWIIVQPNEKDLNLARKINYYSTKESKNCIVCNVKFYHGRSNAKRCNYHKIYSICPTCGFLHLINLDILSGTANNEIIEEIQNNKEIQSFCCSECLYNYIGNLEIVKENARKNCDKMNSRIDSFCEKCNKITNHNGFGTCLECNPIFTEQFCVVCNENTIHRNNNCCICSGNGYHLKYCKTCDKETMHNGSICCNCNPSSNGQYGVNGKVNRPYAIKFCEKCNCETPHSKNNKTITENEDECLVCKGNYIWCEHCERWETPSFNSRPNHWMFWAAETKQWMDDNYNKVDLAKKIIIGLNDILNSPIITGVYGWFINDQISYVGESVDILTRSWNHIMYIFEEPDYWYNVIDYLNKNKIEVKILENVDRNDPKYKNMTNKEFKSKVLKPLELKWIDKLHPDSQKCDGTDHIRPVKERKIKINK